MNLMLLIFPVILLASLVFLTLRPHGSETSLLRTFNRITWFLTSAAVGAAILLTKFGSAGSEIDGWWPILAAIAGAITFAAMLLIATVVRFFLLRGKRA